MIMYWVLRAQIAKNTWIMFRRLYIFFHKNLVALGFRLIVVSSSLIWKNFTPGTSVELKYERFDLLIMLRHAFHVLVNSCRAFICTDSPVLSSLLSSQIGKKVVTAIAKWIPLAIRLSMLLYLKKVAELAVLDWV